jgi:hypothetical protein
VVSSTVRSPRFRHKNPTSVPPPTTPASTHCLSHATPQAQGPSLLELSGFAFRLQARRSPWPNRVRHPADCWLTSRCSPPCLAATQLRSISRAGERLPGGDSNPFVSVPSRAHKRPTSRSAGTRSPPHGDVADTRTAPGRGRARPLRGTCEPQRVARPGTLLRSGRPPGRPGRLASTRRRRRHANRPRPRQSSAASRNGARLPAGRHREPFFEAADLPVSRDGSRPRQHRRHANRLRPRQSSAASRNGARLPAGRHREPFFEAADLPVGRDGSRPRQHRRHANRPRPRQSSAASRNGADQFGEGGRECPPERGTTRNPSSKRPTSRSAGTARVHGSIADTRTASVHPCAADSSSSRSRISSTSARIACARA